MTIRFPCPGCGGYLNAPEEFQGKNANCKKCGSRFLIPAASSTAAPPAALSAGIDTVAKSAQPMVPPATVHEAPAPKSSVPQAAVPRTSAPRAAVPPATVSRTEARRTALPKLDREQLLSAISGSVKKVPLSLGYKLSLLAVSLLMVLLPLIYVALVGAIAVGAAIYSVTGLAWFDIEPTGGPRNSQMKFAVLAYAGPLVIAVITVIFMIKPFFARMPKSAKPRSLSRDEQPLLFELVQRICQAVGAPMPRRIDVDTEVNASASFRSGWLSLLQPNDLVLTIGMPLVKGLTVAELGGILAHEFGHFSQGVGMRLTYIVRSINMWFARVVYQRDRADEWLSRTAKSLDFRLSIVLYLAMGVIWLTRKILWVLMMLGHMVSSLLMRQMEYDADSYEIQWSGTETFEATFMKLQRLGLAYHQSLAESQEFFVDGKLVDDLPSLVVINRDAQPAEVIQQLQVALAGEEGSWFDTHPTDADRIFAARKINAAGVFHLEAPAEALFERPDQLSKEVTRDFFQAIFGDEFNASMLASVQDLTSFKQAAKEAEDARVRMFSSAFTNPRAMHLGQPIDRGQAASESIAQLQRARQQMEAGLSDYERASQRFDEVDSQWLACHQAAALMESGAKLKPDDWKTVPVKSAAEVEQQKQNSQLELAHLHEELLRFEQAFASRVDAALQWLFSAAHGDASSTWAKLIAQAQTVLQCLAAQDQVHRTLVDLRNDFGAVYAIFASAGQSVNEKQWEVARKHGDRLKGAIQHVNGHFANVAYPFEHAEGPMSMSRYLAPKAGEVKEYSDALEVTDGLLKNYHYSYFRSIGTLAAVIEKVESAALA